VHPSNRRSTAIPLGLVAALAMSGCVQYHPVPLDAPGLATDFAARRLDDPGLRRFLSGNGLTPPTSSWTPRTLALVAVFFHPGLDLSRAAWREAVAGEITAGGRPAAAVGVSGDHAARPDEGKSTPWSVALNADLSMELGRARGARLARARALSLAAKLRVAADAWRLAGEAQAAGMALVVAHGAVENATSERFTLDTVLTLTRLRYEQGAASVAEVSRAEADVLAAGVAVSTAEQAQLGARASLAQSLGLPFAGVETIAVVADSGATCGTIDSLPLAAVTAAALQTRPDVGAQLATYAGAELDVRLAVAEQYPDLTLGPSLGWDQGIGRWTLNVGFARLMLGRNRGSIAQAEARRSGAAALVDSVQQSVATELARSYAECRRALEETVAVDSVWKGANTRLSQTTRAFERGETGALDLALARLDIARVRAAVSTARGHLIAANVALERALPPGKGNPMGAWPDVTELTEATRAPRP